MHCLHGIRVISTAWVVLGHTHLSYVMAPFRNMSYALTVSFFHLLLFQQPNFVNVVSAFPNSLFRNITI